MAAGEGWAGKVVAAAGGLILAYAAIRVVAPFVGVLALAAVVAVLVEPLSRRLRTRLSKSVSSAVVAGGVCLAFALPLSLGGWYLAREAAGAYPLVREAVQGPPAPAGETSPWLAAARDYLRKLNVTEVLSENVQELGAWSARLARSAAGNVAVAAMDLVVFVAGLFLFARDGDAALERLDAAVPLAAPAKERIRRRTREMIVATFEGVFVVALVQGLLSTIGLALFGVAFPVLLGALCMAFSPIPIVGTAIVWVPVAASAAISGHYGKALLLAVWFSVVVGLSDNVLRPILIGARTRLPVALVLIGVLGGIKAMGPIGAFLGPVVMAVAAAVADVLLEEAVHERA